MTKIIERIFDAQTGATTDIERDMTAAEIKYRKDLEKTNATEQAEAEAKATAKAALLTQLGITEEQAKLLLS